MRPTCGARGGLIYVRRKCASGARTLCVFDIKHGRCGSMSASRDEDEDTLHGLLGQLMLIGVKNGPRKHGQGSSSAESYGGTWNPKTDTKKKNAALNYFKTHTTGEDTPARQKHTKNLADFEAWKANSHTAHARRDTAARQDANIREKQADRKAAADLVLGLQRDAHNNDLFDHTVHEAKIHTEHRAKLQRHDNGYMREPGVPYYRQDSEADRNLQTARERQLDTIDQERAHERKQIVRDFDKLKASHAKQLDHLLRRHKEERMIKQEQHRLHVFR